MILGMPDERARALGDAMHVELRTLYPLCRSLTGEGVRATLNSIGKDLPLQVHEVPSGTAVLDWTVPDEWNIRAASIETLGGERLVDFSRSNLHVVGYSRAVDAVVSREQLASHVFTLPEQPELIPYRTAYYGDSWGFCLSHRLWTSMQDSAYRVRIDSTLSPGTLTYGELALPGLIDEDVLVSCHCCHPSLANDNLSGLVVAAEVARRAVAATGRRQRGLRMVFVPATIGPLVWLARNPDAAARISAGLVLTCLGDTGGFHYKSSRRGSAVVDRLLPKLLADQGRAVTVLPFTPFGYDERQYCSPGFDLPVGCLMRSPNGTFPEYHTSADDPDFVRPASLAESAEAVWEVLEALDHNWRPMRVDGRGEPQLGRRNLYSAVGGQHRDSDVDKAALLWLLNLADGKHDLTAIAERAGLPFGAIRKMAERAKSAGLVSHALDLEKEGVSACRA